ncbi:hypothetical protein HanXRQr2_Chr11g0486341 [Helianthus annuus]|uniref:Uncharacterized protein n=1 Tax=Helianthus annuus TaxID=4232 RepID=A0A251TDP4_HELAN|nr:hypothetical protein HanXRQr2_Chr11g0486341 [Helianthus annuus]KAJ0874792.1 hypothetical protein HanPSC8_Chr11g0468461 [Helianthus annuus]
MKIEKLFMFVAAGVFKQQQTLQGYNLDWIWACPVYFRYCMNRRPIPGLIEDQ